MSHVDANSILWLMSKIFAAAVTDGLNGSRQSCLMGRP